MKYLSSVKKLGQITFPEYKGDRVYMRPFFKRNGLPVEFKRWQSTVDQMLDGIETNDLIYLMIDQTFVKAGQAQRRPGLHIDGYWDGGKHSSHTSKPPNHHSGSTSWGNSTFRDPEAIILASNVYASRGFNGYYEGPIKEMGDCSHVIVGDLKEVLLEPNIAYCGNVTFLHESLPVKEDCFRTLVRLNLPGFELTK